MIFTTLGDPPATLYLWIALVMGGLFAYPTLILLRALKSRQTVSQYAPEGHAKKQGTPTMGGLIIMVGFVSAMVAMLAFPMRSEHPVPVGLMLLLFVLYGVIGFVDDFAVPRMFPGKRGLGWKQKIVMQLVAALVFAVPLWPGDWAAIGEAVFLVLFFSNAYNFADGLDGLAGSLLVVICFGLVGIMGGNRALTPIPLALIGATIPFLFLNAPPARVFMGDVGSLPIGATLGAVYALLILGPTASAHSMGDDRGIPGVSLAILSIVMIVTLVPVPLQIASVKLRKGKRLFPYTPIHHAFEKAGWPESRVVWCYVLVQFVLALVAVQVSSLQGAFATIQ